MGQEQSKTPQKKFKKNDKNEKKEETQPSSVKSSLTKKIVKQNSPSEYDPDECKDSFSETKKEIQTTGNLTVNKPTNEQKKKKLAQLSCSFAPKNIKSPMEFIKSQ